MIRLARLLAERNVLTPARLHPDTFVMMMDMPGVAQSDIGLEIDGTVVRVNCEYKVPDELQTDKARTHRACAASLVAHARTRR